MVNAARQNASGRGMASVQQLRGKGLGGTPYEVSGGSVFILP